MQTCLRLGLTVSDEILYYNTLFTDQLLIPNYSEEVGTMIEKKINIKERYVTGRNVALLRFHF